MIVQAVLSSSSSPLCQVLMPACPHADTDETRYYEYANHGKRRYCPWCWQHKHKDQPLFSSAYEKALKQVHPYEHDTDRTCAPEQLKTIPQLSDFQWKVWWYGQQRNPATRCWKSYLFELPAPENPIPIKPGSVLDYAQHLDGGTMDFIFGLPKE